ncbi:tetratricopeptide repeat protein [Ascidiaceihabitans sp.]|uniref:tetratricopeptide repeat protein n=1 Tax=Ascidiaceihabitans sp. TaxID=1872644 RepID=UPI003296B103
MQQAGRDIHGIPPDQHERILNERLAELRSDLQDKFDAIKRADSAEAQIEIMTLQRKVQEYERRVANPEFAYKEYQDRIAALEKLLEDATVDIGENRIRNAQVALEGGDHSKADEIFDEVIEVETRAAQRLADAHFGKGVIAEEAVRWADAATHYARAARLADTLDTLFKAAHFAKLAGDYKSSLRFAEDMVAKARAEDDRPNLSRALDRLASAFKDIGKYVPSEALFREALQIDATDQGKTSRTYATCLNNLALVVEAQGRFTEAEGLYREALEIDRATIGEGHPEYATRLNNLALVVKAQGRYADAEGLYHKALEIDRATIGEGHPDYAIPLNNLGGVVEAQGRFADAEGLYRAALEITRATIGEAHPDYAIRLGNLGSLLGQTGRATKGREMLEHALGIFRATLPEDHPNIATTLGHIADLPDTP